MKIDAVAAVAVLPFASTWAVLFRGPSGYLAVVFPRHWRASFRNWRINRHWKPKPRGSQRSSRQPEWLRKVVFAADRNRCVWCREGQREVWARGDRLQIDHLIPWSWGGLTCVFNSVTLCGRDNRVKSTVWVDRRGVVHGRGWNRSRRTQGTGADIYRREHQARCSPLRCLRAAMAIMTTF